MTYKEAIREIESHKLTILLNVASNLRTFLRSAQQQAAISVLTEQPDSLRKCAQIFMRILELSREKVDPRYEHKWDTALALYIWILSIRNFKLAVTASEVVFNLPRCWWATKVAQNILFGSQIYSDGDMQEEEWKTLTPISASASTIDSEELVFVDSLLSDEDKMSKYIRIGNGESRVADPSMAEEIGFNLFADERNIVSCDNPDSRLITVTN